jgi:Zn finger protein HypA/HybF involved in hydrogenase expression
MLARIRCRHCGEWSEVEDMGCFKCPKCGKFFISMSEFIRDEINKTAKIGEANG